MNKVMLVGRIANNIELKFLPNTGKAVAKFNLAVNNPFKKNSDGKTEADFIPVVVFGGRAESLSTHMKKGRYLTVSGRIAPRSYLDKDNVKRYVTEVVADDVEFVDWGGNRKGDSTPTGYDEATYGDEMTPVDDGDIPF